MTERIEPARSSLLARKGEARPALQPDNDNVESDAGDAIGDSTGEVSMAGPALIEAAIALAGGRRAAFTLRLDPARHLRLRLACAIGQRSAQAIVSDALDAYLKTIPGIERLAAAAMAEGGDQAAPVRGSDR